MKLELYCYIHQTNFMPWLKSTIANSYNTTICLKDGCSSVRKLQKQTMCLWEIGLNSPPLSCFPNKSWTISLKSRLYGRRYKQKRIYGRNKIKTWNIQRMFQRMISRIHTLLVWEQVRLALKVWGITQVGLKNVWRLTLRIQGASSVVSRRHIPVDIRSVRWWFSVSMAKLILLS